MKYESSFKSEADGLEISVMALIPDKKPYRAVVQLVHGMSEHKERYIPFMQYLAKLGYVVVIHDHRGHGKSVKHQDDLGLRFIEQRGVIELKLLKSISQITVFGTICRV